MKKVEFDWGEYIRLSRQAAAEGAVLLKNDNNVLPAGEGETIAVFGRGQFDYIKCGTGSGGLVNVPYVVNYYDGFKNCDSINLYEPLADVYREWLKDHPFDKGGGWAQEPKSQVEMPLTDEVCEDAAKNASLAIVIINRLAGEDKDCEVVAGNYLLSDGEREMLSKVTAHFEKVAVLLNSGDIIDMKWVEEYNPGAVIYVWQGGCEGGNAAADLVSGKVTPSGKLAETIAYDITDYPSNSCFGDKERNFYEEDIYVGYRYFETFAKDKVMYPFGFGLSYTEFDKSFSFSLEEKPSVNATVKNVGNKPGKEVIQVYMEAPQGFLGKPARTLVAFAKTKLLLPGESDELCISWDSDRMASYDDTGMTGFKNAFVLEEGQYDFYAGSDVRSAEQVGGLYISENTLIEETTDALYPVRAFERIIPEPSKDGYTVSKAPVPLKTRSVDEMIADERGGLLDIPYTGDKGIKLSAVKEGRASMYEFLGQLTEEDMLVMSRGEGMNSSRVTPGTCAAYGGVSDRLQNFGIPAAACTDGPSGIRIDSGVYAMQYPNGSCLASTFDLNLVSELFSYVGLELLRDKIDCLLGPGMNIKRHPLNGRNFEYFSEDPLLTGAMAVAELTAMRKWKTTGCIKHFACNNQETARYSSDSVVSARALREIYLKGFEMAVKEGGANHVMTTYAVLNGWHTAGNFELNTMVLRDDWGFEGLSETDWWAKIGVEDDPDASINKTGLMIRSQGDVYMVTNSSEENENNDDSKESFAKGLFTRPELLRNTKNILSTVMTTPAYDRFYGEEIEIIDLNKPVAKEKAADAEFALEVSKGTELPIDKLVIAKDAINLITLKFPERGEYKMLFDVAGDGKANSQISVTFSVNNTVMKVVTINGGETEWKSMETPVGHGNIKERFLRIIISQGGIKFRNMIFIPAE